METQQLRIEARFSTRFSTLDSREDRELSVNLLLNGTVCFFGVGGGYGFCSDRCSRQG